MTSLTKKISKLSFSHGFEKELFKKFESKSFEKILLVWKNL
jgi:hypothetical protein